LEESGGWHGPSIALWFSASLVSSTRVVDRRPATGKDGAAIIAMAIPFIAGVTSVQSVKSFEVRR
jgi:hypothetical protein